MPLMSDRRNRRSEVNLLELIPEVTVGFETNESRIVTILAPRFRNRLMLRLLVPRLRNPWFRVSLDEIGSEVWLLCDGKRTIGEIGELLRARFQERVEPCYDRLAVFFRQLEEARFISFINMKECLKARRP
jgi:hypothetical protein